MKHLACTSHCASHQAPRAITMVLDGADRHFYKHILKCKEG